jgi:lipoprotein signal peptidase
VRKRDGRSHLLWSARVKPAIHARRKTDVEPHRSFWPVAWIATIVAILDWTSKALVFASLPLDRRVVVASGRVAFWHVRNEAMILGLFGDLPLRTRQGIAVLLGIVGVTLLREVLTRAHRLLPRRRPWGWLFVGLVLGGMLGNLGERVLHWGVTDFLSFRWGSVWLPPGNVADLAIILSIPISLLVIAFEIEARSLRGSAHESVPAASPASGPGG